MSQKNNLFYNFISSKFIYIFLQKVMSSTYVRKNFVKGYVKKNYNVLDVGSGLSTILEGLPEINYYGFDIDIDNIKYAKKKFPD